MATGYGTALRANGFSAGRIRKDGSVAYRKKVLSLRTGSHYLIEADFPADGSLVKMSCYRREGRGKQLIQTAVRTDVDEAVADGIALAYRLEG